MKRETGNKNVFKMRVASEGQDGYNILGKANYLDAGRVEPGWLLLALSKTPSYRICFIPRNWTGDLGSVLQTVLNRGRGRKGGE